MAKGSAFDPEHDSCRSVRSRSARDTDPPNGLQGGAPHSGALLSAPYSRGQSAPVRAAPRGPRSHTSRPTAWIGSRESKCSARFSSRATQLSSHRGAQSRLGRHAGDLVLVAAARGERPPPRMTTRWNAPFAARYSSASARRQGSTPTRTRMVTHAQAGAGIWFDLRPSVFSWWGRGVKRKRGLSDAAATGRGRGRPR